MDSNNIFSLTHQSDIDGVGSAALIKMRYGLPSKNMFFTDYSVKNVVRSKEEITKAVKTGAVLIIADFGLNEAIKKHMSELIDYIKGKQGNVYWFDHHPWDEESIKSIASKCDAAIVNENAKFCATEIVRNELMLNNKFCMKFAELVHYCDFNIMPKDRNKMRKVITYGMCITAYNQIEDYDKRCKKLRKVAETICNHKLSDRIMEKDAANFDRINASRINEMVKNNMIVLDNVAVGFQKRVQSTVAGGALLKSSGKDISIYINLDTMQGHIRTKKANCTPLAVYFGGGGHPHASGFTMKKGYDLSKATDRKRFALLADKKAAELCR